MENSDKDVLLLQSLSRTLSVESNAEANPEPEPEQQEPQRESPSETQPKSKQETPETPTFIELRIDQLQSRLLILQNAQEVKRKAADNSSEATDETVCEGSDDGGELEEVQKELATLQVKKLEKLGKCREKSGFTANEDQQKAFSTSHKPEAPHGGIYILPPPHLHQACAADQIIPVERLGKTATYTRCPSCEVVVRTEIQSQKSEAMWLLCCLLSMMGCVAGCCLIPFFVDSMKKVYHHCPNCQANIHIYQPL